jgi:hypothetical protein
MQGFDLVIGDTGAVPKSWDASSTRVYAEVAGEPLYFSSMAGAFFALRGRFGERVHIDRLLVADYADGTLRTLLDARYAWYFWDSERLSVGNLPLIFAFPTKAEAQEETQRHHGSALDFRLLSERLGRWCAGARDEACWRGASGWDDTRWSQEWNRRWEGWVYDSTYGWCDGRTLGQPWPGQLHDNYNWQPYYGPGYASPSPGRVHDHHGRRDRDEQAARERREREQREREQRERREREERERKEREERERQPVNKGTHDPQPAPQPKNDPPPKVQPKQEDDHAQPAPPPKAAPEKPKPAPEKKDDQAKPAPPPPPPTKGTNDPKK